MNILFMHKCFIKGGGVERVHQNLAMAFNTQGVTNAFFVLDGFGESEEGFTLLKNSFVLSFRASKHRAFLTKIFEAFECIKNNDIDAIISATEQANLVTFICKLRFPKLKVVYTRHCAFDVSDQSLPPWAIKLIYSLFVLNGEVVGVSLSLKSQLQKAVFFNKQRVHFIPNAVVSDDIFRRSKEKVDEWNYSRYFIAVGRLVEQKGFDILVDAYSVAIKHCPTLPILVIIGEGEDLQELKVQVNRLDLNDTVIFAGYFSNPYYPINNAEAFILSSRHEGMPTVLVEAMSLNTPVIAFDCPTGPSELIRSDNGVLVEYLSVEKLAHALINYKVVPYENIDRSVQHFRFPDVARNYLSLFGVK